ncbi:unnamed protein product, partial [Cyprideis torosa]
HGRVRCRCRPEEEFLESAGSEESFHGSEHFSRRPRDRAGTHEVRSSSYDAVEDDWSKRRRREEGDGALPAVSSCSSRDESQRAGGPMATSGEDDDLERVLSAAETQSQTSSSSGSYSVEHDLDLDFGPSLDRIQEEPPA